MSAPTTSTTDRLLLTGGDVVTGQTLRRCDLLVVDGQIAALFAPDQTPSLDAARIDASGRVVLPGLIDGHTHFIQNDESVVPPDPDAVEYEGFIPGGRAAAAGGVTTVVEMPQSFPPACDGRSFARKRDLIAAEAVVDFTLWGGVLPDQSDRAVAEQIELGAAGLKAFMCNSDPMYPGSDDARLVRVLEQLDSVPLMLGLHAENDALLAHYEAIVQADGRTDPLAHADARPKLVEIEAVARAVLLAEQLDRRVHIVHLSTPEAAAVVKAARARGVRVSCETCPQYIALDHSDLRRLAGYARCAPAIRSAADVAALWPYLLDGTIDCVTSDHCGFTTASKERGFKDIFAAPNGLSGIQTLGPVTWTEARKRGMSWVAIAEILATAPARLWGLTARKGQILPGLDADLVIIDPERESIVSADELLHTHRWTPFAGRKLRGRIERTLLRGRTVHVDGESVAAELTGGGTFVPAWTTERRA